MAKRATFGAERRIGAAALQGPVERRALLLGGLCTLAACTSLSPPKTTLLTGRIVAGAGINPSPSGQASPVAVRLYALRNDAAFRQSDFQSLFTTDAQVLGDNLVLKREYVIVPGATQPLKEDLPPEAVFLGILAAFRTIDFAQWRTIQPLQPGRVNEIEVSLSEVSVAITQAKVSAQPWW